MARFETAYEKYVKPWEGGYANVANDKGGETYAGISRKFFPTWSGWATVDAIKKERAIRHNELIPSLTDKVKTFYRLAFWDKYGFSSIVDQNIANILFDWLVNSGGNAAGTVGVETFGVDEILNRDFGTRLKIDRIIEKDTINAINNVNAKQLYETIKVEREKYYRTLAEDPTQRKFLQGWLNRLQSFPGYMVGSFTTILLILIIGLIYIFIN